MPDATGQCRGEQTGCNWVRYYIFTSTSSDVQCCSPCLPSEEAGGRLEAFAAIANIALPELHHGSVRQVRAK